jgi:Flp pilus assembly protein TadG
MSKRVKFLSARSAGRAEEGQILILAAGAMVAMLMFAAIAIDVGFFLRTKRDLQNDADAMALAGSRELPSTSSADTLARQWGTNNTVTAAEVQSITFGTTCSGTAVQDTITVRLQRPQTTFLAKVVGINSATLKACATARAGSAAAGSELLPFGFLVDDPGVADVCFFDDNPDLWTETCVLKIPKPNDTWTSGNTGPLRLDEGGDDDDYDGDCNLGGSGSSEYEENIRDGSECMYAPGDDVRTKTGSMVGPTCDALTDEIGGNTDSFSDVFSNPVNGTYTTVDKTSPRYGLIPVVEVPAGASGSSTEVVIVTFITVYIEDWDCDGANKTEIVVRPVKSNVYQPGIDFAVGGPPGANWPVMTIKLVD